MVDNSNAKELDSSRDTIIVYASDSGKMPYTIQSSAYPIFTFGQSVYGSTIDLSSEYNLIPAVIEKWSWDFKHKKYILDVNTKFKFHNGRNVSATDIEFMLMRSFLSTKSFQQNKWLQNIVDIEKLEKETAFKSGMIKGINVLSNHQLEVFLKTPNPSFMYIFTKGTIALKPNEELEKDLIAFKKLPIGLGNYKVTSTNESEGLVVLERFDDNLSQLTNPPSKHPKHIKFYVKGDPIKLNADLVLGSLDVYGADPSKSKKQYRKQYADKPTSISVMNFNYFNSLAQKKEFREAIALMINRQKLIEEYFGRTPVLEMIPDVLWGRYGAPEEYNPSKAKEMLKQFVGKQKRKFIIKFHGGMDTPPYIEELDRQFKSVGLDIEFQRTTQLSIEKGKEDDVIAYIAGMPVDFSDPLLIFSLYLKDSIKKFLRPSTGNEDFDALYQAAINTSTFSERNEKIKKLSKYMNTNKIAIPLFSVRAAHTVSNKIKTLGKQPVGLSVNLSNIELNDGI